MLVVEEYKQKRGQSVAIHAVVALAAV